MAKILAADIGGTNCRLGLFTFVDGALTLQRTAWVKTGDVPHTDALLAAFERELTTLPLDVDAAVVAIAGPTTDSQHGKLTNSDLEVDFTPLNRERMRFYLINDFMAQAYAVLSPEGEAAQHIAGPEKPLLDGTRAVIGAGTGLGQAMLKRLMTPSWGQAAQWMAMPSENGHVGFPFVGPREQELHEFLCEKLEVPFASAEDTVAGRGLEQIYHFLTGEKLTAAEVSTAALKHQTETLDLYARFYGRICRNWMLTTLCSGGLWIAGGIAAKNPLVVTCDAFKRELYASPRWRDYLATIPVYLMNDTNSGLWGAARFGQQQVEVGL